MIRTKGEAGTGDVVEAVRHIRTLHKERSLSLSNILHTSACPFAACLQHACSMLARGCGFVLLSATPFSPSEHFVQEIRMVQMMEDEELFTYAKDSGIGLKLQNMLPPS